MLNNVHQFGLPPGLQLDSLAGSKLSEAQYNVFAGFHQPLLHWGGMGAPEFLSNLSNGNPYLLNGFENLAGYIAQPKKKRHRTAFSPDQLHGLEEAFKDSHYLVGQERKNLAQKLDLTEAQVKVWFQNRRTKDKREKSSESPGNRVHHAGQCSQKLPPHHHTNRRMM